MYPKILSKSPCCQHGCYVISLWLGHFDSLVFMPQWLLLEVMMQIPLLVERYKFMNTVTTLGNWIKKNVELKQFRFNNTWLFQILTRAASAFCCQYIALDFYDCIVMFNVKDNLTRRTNYIILRFNSGRWAVNFQALKCFTFVCFAGVPRKCQRWYFKLQEMDEGGDPDASHW